MVRRVRSFYFLQSVLLVLFLLSVSFETFAQPAVLYTSLSSTTPTATNNRFDVNPVSIFRQCRFQANQSGNFYWAFSLGTPVAPDYSINWRPYTAGNKMLYNTFIPATIWSDGALYNTSSGGWDGEIDNIQNGYYYTFNVGIEALADNIMEVLETSYNPTPFSSLTSTWGTNGQRIVTVVMNAPPQSSENVFLRYTTGGINFPSSSTIQFTMIGNTGTAVIPAQAQGATVHFYAYSSPRPKVDIDTDVLSYGQSAHDMATLMISGIPASYIETLPINVASANASSNGDYATLAEAFTAINNFPQAGNNIIITVNGSTIEPTTGAILNQNASPWNSMVIYPTATGYSITGNLAGLAVIRLFGADKVTIDGRVGAAGSTPDLVISNTSTSSLSGTSTIFLDTDATTNLITYCNVQGSSTTAVAANGGNIFIGDAAVATGNDNNTISYCNIGPAGSNLPTKGVYLSGSTGSTPLNNSLCTVTNNNIFDYFSAATGSSGIYVANGNTDCSFTTNRFYQTSARTQTTGAQHSAIWLANGSGNNYSISGNTIGYSNTGGSGTYSLSGLTGTQFIPIYLNVGTTAVTNVQSNTIAGIAISGSCNGTDDKTPFTGIYVAAGLVNIGGIAANTIGSMTAIGSITFSSSSVSTSDLTGIYSQAPSDWITNNNFIGGITASNTGVGAIQLTGIRAFLGASSAWICNNNTIGGTIGNSIYNTSTSINSWIDGIYNQRSSGTIINNTIRNLTAAGGAGGGATTIFSVIGIAISASSGNHTVSQNTINNLSNVNTTQSTDVYGIMYTGSTGTNTVERNFIYSLANPSTDNTATLIGIKANGGTTTYKNNIVSLSANSLGAIVNGFNDGGGTNNIYHNTISLNGSSTFQDAAYFSSGTNARNILNNIFANTQTGSVTHNAINISSSTNLTIDYNDYIGTVTGGGGGGVNSLTVSPGFGNVSGTALTDYIPSATTLTGTNSLLGTINADIDGDIRCIPTMGAQENPIAPGVATATASPNPICSGGTVTLTGSSAGATTWSWSGPGGFTASTQIATVPNVTASGTYTLTASNCNGSAAPVSVTITIGDTEPPVAICKDITVFLNAAGNASIVAADVDNGSTDNCAIASRTIDKNTFNCSDISAAAPVFSDLIISEYVEGSGNNKAIEIYNGTGSAINLAAGGYTIKMYFNGSVTATTINLTGSVANGATYVLVFNTTTAPFADPLLLAKANQISTVSAFNGDDAVELAKGATTLDVIGQIGFRPVTEWGTGLTSTADNTLRRNPSITTGDVNGSNVFDPSVEWAGFAMDDFTGLGTHSATGGVGTPVLLTITDVNGLSSSCTAHVNVLDNTPPTAVCQNIPLPLDGSGNATLTPAMINNGSSDNCGILSLSVNSSAFTCADLNPPPTSDLFISEYVEGSSNNKAIEIYNGTGNAINLNTGGYAVKIYFNGSTTAATTVNLTGTIANGATYVLVYNNTIAPFADPALLAKANQITTAGFYNGDDAVELVKGAVTLDVIGQIGFDPGSEWGTGLISTADNTLRRNPSITTGDVNGSNVFVPSVEWTGYATDDFSGLGSHLISSSGIKSVVLTVTDVNGNISTCTSTVTIQDNIAPVFTTCPTSPSTICVAGTTYTHSNNTWNAVATDNCTLSPTMNLVLSGATTLSSGTTLNGVTFNLGTTHVVWTATDAKSNSNTCSFDVIISAIPAAPTGLASQSFCSITTPTVGSLVATGTAIQWYAAPSGGTSLANSTPLLNGTNYYASQTVNGCESATRFAVTVTIADPAAPTGTSPQAFCSINNPTLASISVTGTTIQWYTASTGGSLLPGTTALVTGTTYYASQTVAGCESDTRLAVTVTVADPAAPTGTSPQAFCSINNPTLASISVTGATIQWYTASTGGSLLPGTTALVTGTTYYASQTMSGCESDTRLAVTVTVADPAAPTGTSPQAFCSINNPTLASISVTGATIQWYTASTGGSLLPGTTALVTGTTYYASQTVADCESDTRLAVTVTVADPAAPTGTSPQVFCSNGNPTLASISVTGATIQWYTASTGGSLLPGTTALVTGTTYYASQTVAGCESDTRLAVTVNYYASPTISSFTPTSGPIGTIVTITGTNFSATPANNIVFFGATMATVTASSATSLTVTVPAGATYQSISVTTLLCGLTAYSAQPFIVTFDCGGVIENSSFSAHNDFAGSNPNFVSAGDLDGDGKADLVVANYGPNTISVYRNTSSPGIISFSPRVDIATGVTPISIAIGDLDGDGKPDVTVANWNSSSVSVFRNTSSVGNISFAARADYSTGSGAGSVTMVDLDVDGRADLAVTNYNSNTLSILRNTSTPGSISFATKVDYTTGSRPRGVSNSDYDGDGLPDLAVDNQTSNTLSIFRNLSTPGNISLASRIDYTAGTNADFNASGDLDGDGKPDVVVVNGISSTISVFRNLSTPGTISFAPKSDYPTDPGPFGISINDLDGDGKPDLASANGGISVFKNTSIAGNISFAARVNYATAGGANTVSACDLDGDGKSDLAVANGAPLNISVLRNTVTGSIATINTTPLDYCGTLVSGSLGGNIPVVGTGAWSQVSGPGTSTFSDATSGTSIVTATLYGTYVYRWTISNGACTPSTADITIIFTPTVGTPVFTLGSISTRCQGAGTVTYTASATNTTGITYSLDAASISGGNSIVSGTGAVTYVAGWSGTSVITASAAGCNGPLTATHTVTVTPTVGTPTAITISAGTEPICQLTNGTTTTTYATTATNNTGFNWSVLPVGAGTINATTGVMTWSNGYSGTATISVTANGCNGPSSSVTRTVIVTSTVGTPTAITISAGTEPSCQLTNGTTTTTYTTTATNSTSFNWSVLPVGAGTINATTGVMTWANGYSGTATISVTANGCNGPSSSVTHSVTITTLPTAIISYSGSPYCPNSGTAIVTLTGTAGGSYTSTTGLEIISTSGDIDLAASTPATYTVTYTVAAAGGCPVVTATTNVNIKPIAVVTPVPDLDYCHGVTTAAINFTSSPAGATFNWTSSIDLGFGVSGTGNFPSFIANNTTAIPIIATVVVKATYNGCIGLPINFPITINPKPVVTIDARVLGTSTHLDGACQGTPFDLYSTASPFVVDQPVQIYSEGFEAGANGWTNVIDVNDDTKWTIFSSPHSTGTGTYTAPYLPVIINSGSSFYLADNTYGHLAKEISLISPVITTTGYTGISLDFSDYYRDKNKNIGPTDHDFAYIDVSTDGGPWTNVTYFDETHGYPYSFAIETIDLKNYTGSNTIQIRFRFEPTRDFYWAIDNVKVYGISPTTGFNIAWTSNPVGYTNNFNTSPTVTQTATTTYRATYTDKNTGCSGFNEVPVENYSTVIPTISVANPQNICSGETALFSVNTEDLNVTREWSLNEALQGVTTPTYTTIPILNAGPGAATYNAKVTTINSHGCYATSLPSPVYVYPTIQTNTIAISQTICSGSTPSVLLGSTPTPFAGPVYLWQSSTTDAVNGFGNAVGTRTGINYTPGALTQTTWFRRRVTWGGCSDYSNVIEITVNALPTVANAGPDQTSLCGVVSTTLAANTPAVGTGAWTITSGAGGTVTTPTSPTSPFTGVAGTAYTLRWTISNAPCTASFDDVNITFNQNPTVANAGPDQTSLCGVVSIALAANTPAVGTGAWSIISGAGGSFANTAINNTTFTGTAGSTYVLQWTISNSPCTASSDQVTITFNQNPTVSNAGPDQLSLCGTTSTTLAGNTPAVGTGLWTIVSGTGGTITTPASATSTFTGTAGSTYVLQWTISNSPCTASSDQVTITFNQDPTVSNAGPDQLNLCGTTSTTLAGNTPVVGTGLWTIVSGTGGTITTPASATSTFTGTAGSTYVLQWTISNSPCTASSDQVTITFNQNPTVSNAGPDQLNLCGTTSTTLAGNTPVVGTGLWTIVSGTGGTITTPASATSTFTGTAGSTYVLQWTISNSPCTASSDQLTITFNQNPTTSNAGPDQTSLCGTTSTTLAGNTPAVGTGLWTIVSGTGGTITTPASATSTFTGTAGSTYVLQWTISNSPCTASSDQVTITFNQNPTTSNAGPDQTSLCGTTSTTLAGNTPAVGTGLWTIVSGTGGTITTPASATSTFTGTAGSTYVLQWTISNSPCTASSDQVTITFNQNPTTSNAGLDQTSLCGTNTTTLAANTPTVGTGAWTIFAGTGGSITTPTSSTSAFTGIAGNTYTLRWTISNAPCTASTDDVIITFNQIPAADAGGDRSIFTGQSTQLGASLVPGNTYLWTASPADPTLTIANNTLSNPTVTPLVTTVYTLTETHNGCQNTNTVTVTVTDNLSITKIASFPVPPKPGDIITYTITVSNLSTSGTAKNLTVTDFLPASADYFTFISSASTIVTDQGTYNNVGRTVVWSIVNLVHGNTETFTVTGRIGRTGWAGYLASAYYQSLGSSTNNITNNAQVESSTITPITTQLVTPVSQYCGVNVPASTYGEVFTASWTTIYYAITLTNTGNITDKFHFTSSQTGQVMTYQIMDAGGIILTETPWLLPGQSFTYYVFIETHGSPTGSTNHTLVTATSTVCIDTHGTTDIETHVTNDNPGILPDLVITKVASPSPVVAGGDIDYTISVRNIGKKAADDVLITDNLPAGTTWVSSSSPTAGVTVNHSGNTVTAFMPSLPTFESPAFAIITLNIKVHTTCSSFPSVANNATVVSRTNDSDPVDNTTTITTPVNPSILPPAYSGSTTICAGTSTILTASGAPVPITDYGYKWYDAATGGNLLYTGNPFTTPALNSNTTYYVSTYLLSDEVCQSNRTAVNVTILQTPVITTQPQSVAVCAGSPAIFTALVTGQSLLYEWQRSTDNGANWSTLSNILPYSGTSTPTLNISSATISMNGYLYMLKVQSGTCTPVYSNPATLTVFPLPQGSLTANGPFCATGSGQLTWTATAGTGPYTVIYNDGTANRTQNNVASGIAFNVFTTPVTTTTIYTLVSVTDASNCVRSSGFTAGSATVNINLLPTAYNVTGGGSYCSGGTGLAVGLSNSQAGVNYQLYLGGVSIGASVAGTGSAISFGNQTNAGVYTVVATNTTTSCIQNMIGNVTVSINPLPTAYNVTGGGSYCSGGTGVAVGLSNSQNGVNYQLYLGGVSIGASVAGTGSAISFGNQTNAGVYTVVATNATTSCIQNMTGNVTVSINPLPTAYNVTGGGSYCSGGTGLAVGLSNSQAGVNYQLYLGGVSIGASVAGTGSAISFGNQTNAGVYTVVATNTTTSCIQNMIGNVTVSINPLPTAYNVTGGGSYCSGGTGVAVGLSNSQNGVNYQLYLGGVSIGATVAGTGSAISFGNQTNAGVYTVVATNTTTSCIQNMTGNVTVSINPLPTAYNVTGGGSYCSRGTGVAVGLSNSQAGVNYQLYLGGVSIGATVAGIGSAISFGNQTNAGVYTVVATNSTTSCIQNMTGNVTVSINPLPTTSLIYHQ